MNINEEELLKIGFKRIEWEDEGERFHEFQYGPKEGRYHLTVHYKMNVELIVNEYDWFPLPFCKTIEDINHLIRILGITK